jgi:hypothetical protein
VALRWNATLTLVNSTLVNCTAWGPDAYGGAVYGEQSAGITLHNCQISNCSAVGDGAKGGAVALVGKSQALVNSSSFSFNSVGDANYPSGGALYTSRFAGAKVMDSRFFNCSSYGPGALGGAISSEAEVGVLEVSGTNSFINCSALGSNGGGEVCRLRRSCHVLPLSV